jgi:PAS domain S-box-containing protein
MELAMPLVRQIRWMALCHFLFLFPLPVFDPCAGLAHAQTQPQTHPVTKTILVLHAHEGNAPVFLGTDKGVSNTLESGGISSPNQFFESLELRRNPGPEHRKLLVEQMCMRYGHRKPDVIITMYPEALEFVLKDCRDILPDVPILALYLPQGLELPETDRRIIGHAPTVDILGTLDIALKLVPGAKRVYVVGGAHEVDRRIEDQTRSISKKWEGPLQFVYLTHMPFEEMLATVSSVPPGSIILVLAFSQDVTTESYTTPIVVQRLSQVSAAPIFGILEPMLGRGIAGGSLLSFELIGAKAGQLALDILAGTKIQDNIPTLLDVPPVPMFDWQQLRRWKLSENALPEGSILINREHTLWDFRFHIIGVLALIVVQSGLIARLLINTRRRRSTEKSLRQKTEELDQFFNVSLDFLCIANTDGHFLRLNPVWEKTLGYSMEELMAKQFIDFVHPDDLERTLKALSTLAAQQKVMHFENRCRAKDGSYRWLEWTSAPAENLIYAVARDFTDRLRAEAEDQQRRIELARMTRITMVGEMTTVLAHEINQPLAAIMSNAQAAKRFLSQAPPDIGEVQQILDDIIRDNGRASDVIRTVRSLVKKDQPQREPLDLNEMIREVVNLFRGDFLLHSLSIRTDLSAGPATVHGDGTQLQQVILNLILNGAAAMRNAPLDQRKIIMRSAMADDRTVKVSVTDFGVGVDENSIERLFEPFYTTKPEGLGMGLSISRTIIKAHGGTIEASNNREGGATFAFTLPALVLSNS